MPLAAFGTRNTLSSTTSQTRGIGAARQWIFDELRRASPRLQVSFDTHKVAKDGRITRDVELRNVLAVLPGRSARRIYLTAHYDTVNIGGTGQIGANTRPSGQPAADPQLRADQDYDVDAPGANDNGSGTALTIELARVLATSGIEFDATIVFALWAGEEQGLVGSRAHVQRLAAEHGRRRSEHQQRHRRQLARRQRGRGQRVRAGVLGRAGGFAVSVAGALHRSRRGALCAVAPDSADGAPRSLRRAAATTRRSTISGYPAVAFREANENFAKQHSALDTVDGVDVAYLAQNARVNVASLAALALAPPAPVVTNDRGQATIGRQPSGYDANLQWKASPGAVAYRIYWRDAWTNDWTHSRLVGNQTQFTLPGLSIDDHVFGVAAVGADGQESLSARTWRDERAGQK